MIVPVHPHVLRWARETRLLTVAQAALRLGWAIERLEAVEHSDEIDNEDLESLASCYKLSTATLLMPDTLPADRYPPRTIDDYRLHYRAEQEPLSIKTQVYVENAFELIELLDEINDADPDVAPRPLLPFAELTDNPAHIARRERARIGVDIEAQLGWEKDKEAFLRWREIVEAQDVVVHKLAMDEPHVRGFAVYRKGYGLVAINSNDDLRARIFTLLHEYAHILLHMGGISDQNRQVPVERWCNQFAANFLMPEEPFQQEYERLFPKGEVSDWAVARLASRFKVSKASAAIRFEELGIAEPGFYDRLKAEWEQGQKHRAGGGGGNDAIETDLGRFGTAHVTTIAHALERGVIDRLEAQYALDVPADHWPLLTVAARERLRAYGPAR